MQELLKKILVSSSEGIVVHRALSLRADFVLMRINADGWNKNKNILKTVDWEISQHL